MFEDGDSSVTSHLLGLQEENTSESPGLESESLLESTFNIILQHPGFSTTPHKLTSDSMFAQGGGSSLSYFSQWPLDQPPTRQDHYGACL